MADSIGFEPMHRLPDEGLAIPCNNHSANYPMAETVRFELTGPCDPVVFKTTAIDQLCHISYGLSMDSPHILTLRIVI